MPALGLPYAMQNLRPGLGEIVAMIETRAPYGAVSLSARQGLKIFVDNRQETVTEENPTAGTVLTAFDGGTMRERAVGGFARDNILQGAREMVRERLEPQRVDISPGPQRRGDYCTPVEIDPSTLTIQEKLNRCRQINQRINRLDSRIVNVRVNYSEVRESSVFHNQYADLAQQVQRIGLALLLVVAGEDGARINFKAKRATAGWEALEFSDEELQILVDETIALLDAERIEPGEYTVIAAPSVAGVICHESFGHGVETDMFLKDRAKANYYLDQVVGSPLLNIVDDPSLPGAPGSYFFDDEGWPAGKTGIVKDGIFQRGITDLYSATVLELPRSPNGRRQDFARKVYARMSNTMIMPGTTPVEELFAQVQHGVYVQKASSGIEDPKGWGIQVTCLFGHEIQNGARTGRVFAPIAISGYVPQVLQSITAVGNDLELEGGTCGKGYKELLAAGDGGPHILLKARLG